METFVLSTEEMKYLGYYTDKKKHHVGSSTTSNVCFLDCEMVETTLGEEVVSIGLGIFQNGRIKTVTLTLKPKGDVLNYLTDITGYTKASVFELTFEEAIHSLSLLLGPKDILIGHHMYKDLQLLDFYHPRVIDCCMVFHHPDGPPHYYSLKNLARMHLKKVIQTGVHDPLEDGLCAFELIQWAVTQGYLKPTWKHIGQSFTPTLELICQALDIELKQVDCVYLTGSRAVGTNTPDSDYDFVVVCTSGLINGALTRYGNMDLCTYTLEYFKNLLQEQTIWAIEAIYSPCRFLETVNLRTFYETSRLGAIDYNQHLRQSIGFEAGRKIASSKKHFRNGNMHSAKKHMFIALRFVEYGRQIVKYNKIQTIKAMTPIWESLKGLDYPEFRDQCNPVYLDTYREFSKGVAKKTPVRQVSRVQHKFDIRGEWDKSDSTPSKKYPLLLLNRYNIIVDLKMQVVAYPFHVFRQALFGEALFGFGTEHIYEKIDGFFMCLYYYEGWQVGTHGDPDGGDHQQLFWETFASQGHTRATLNPHYTYMFELVLRDYVVIIPYKANRLFLTGVRDLDTYQELPLEKFPAFRTPKEYKEPTLEPDTAGCILVNKTFDRVVIRHPDYVKKAFGFPLHRGKKDQTLHVLKVIQDKREERLCTYCPEYASDVKRLKKALGTFFAHMQRLFAESKMESRKRFAIKIQQWNRKYHKYLYALFDKVDLSIFVATLTPRRLAFDINLTASKRTVGSFVDSKDLEKWKQYQSDHAGQISFVDSFAIKSLRYIGGFDMSFDPEDDTRAVAYLSVYDVVSKTIIHESHTLCHLDVPYVSGFLGFREVPHYLHLLSLIQTQAYYPQLLMVDGFGILHHRGFGSASHLGYETKLPTIGVGKTLLMIDGLDKHTVKHEFQLKTKKAGDSIPLVGQSGKVYGVAYRSTNHCVNPIYITIGHKICLESAIHLVRQTCQYRIPEPIRNSDIKSKQCL